MNGDLTTLKSRKLPVICDLKLTNRKIELLNVDSLDQKIVRSIGNKRPAESLNEEGIN